VLEFYASTEAGAILVNLRGAKRGSMGRPLPGSAELRVAQYDLREGRLALGADGFARRCLQGQIGLLLVRVDPHEPLAATPLRGLFEPDDAWLSTGDLFMRDVDGDYWRVDGVRDVIRTARRPVFTTPIRDALMNLPAIDLAVAYGVAPPGGSSELAVAAVTLRAAGELTARELAATLAGLTPDERPDIVHVVAELPVTTWYRPMTAPLKAAGLPQPGLGTPAWYRAGESYRPLSESALRRLARRA
jgi:putative long chain acyl-CoA synthase